MAKETAKQELSNPDKGRGLKRGCFIRKNEDKTVTVVDYPTFTRDEGKAVGFGFNASVPDGMAKTRDFPDEKAAKAWCAEEGYVVCAAPKPPKPEGEAKPEKPAFPW